MYSLGRQNIFPIFRILDFNNWIALKNSFRQNNTKAHSH